MLLRTPSILFRSSHRFQLPLSRSSTRCRISLPAGSGCQCPPPTCACNSAFRFRVRRGSLYFDSDRQQVAIEEIIRSSPAGVTGELYARILLHRRVHVVEARGFQRYRNRMGAVVGLGSGHNIQHQHVKNRRTSRLPGLDGFSIVRRLRAEGKAIPYGTYDVLQNRAVVNVGASHDTSEFAVESIRRWWNMDGRRRYSAASLPICAAFGDTQT